MSWEISQEGQARCVELLEGFLSPIDLARLAIPLPKRLQTPSDFAETHATVLLDLYSLVEEMRFEIAFGSMVLADFEAAVARGTASENVLTDPLTTLGIPVEVLPVLKAYSRLTPAPFALFEDTYQHISGGRVLGTWFAAQLLDSALFRGIAALDRLVILLWTRLERVLPERRGKIFYPSFTSGWLNKLADKYKASPSWSELAKLTEDETLIYVKSLRDGFTHSFRLPSQLHGARLTAYESRGAVVQGWDARTHEAIALALYDRYLREVVRLVTNVMAHRSASSEG